MLHAGKSADIGTDLTQDYQGRGLVDSFQHRQVNACHAVQGSADFKGRIVAPLLQRTPLLSRRPWLALAAIRESCQMGLQLGITFSKLPAVEFVQGNRLLQCEQVFGPPVTL